MSGEPDHAILDSAVTVLTDSVPESARRELSAPRAALDAYLARCRPSPAEPVNEVDPAEAGRVLRSLTVSDDAGVAAIARAYARLLSDGAEANRYHRLEVVSAAPTGRDGVRIGFAIPDELAARFRWRAGQHVGVGARVGGVHLDRHYSICAPPPSPGAAIGELPIAARRVRHALASGTITALRPGDLVDVSPPEGSMSWPDGTARDVVLFAAGSGITPIAAIAGDALRRGHRAELLLVERSRDDVMLGNELRDLAQTYPSAFGLQSVWTRNRGRPTRDSLRQQFAAARSAVGPDPTAYLCGPSPLADAALDALGDAGWDRHDVRRESFTTDRRPDVRVPRPGGRLTVEHRGEPVEVTLRPGETLLVAMLRQGLEQPFSCLSGRCETCVVDLLDGAVWPGAICADRRPDGPGMPVYACIAVNAGGGA